MHNYIIRRLLEGLLTVFAVLVLTFLLIQLLPGDAVLILLSFAPAEYVDQMRHALGLDQPIHIQFFAWFIPIITRFDLGRGITINESINTLLANRLPVTLQLAFSSMLLAIVIALPLGLLAARNRGKILDLVAMQFSQLCQALPELWIATLLFLFLGVKLQILPSGGYVAITKDFLGNLKFMIMPSISLALPVAGMLTRITRSSMLEVLSKDFIITARAKGLKTTMIMRRHVLKNTLMPVVTMIGVELGYLMGGSVIIEDIFLLPGVGRLAITALRSRDIPVIQGVLLFYGCAFVFLNIFVDIIYAFLDPRIKYE